MMEHLYPFATDRQLEVLKAIESEGSTRKAAAKLGLHHSTVDRVVSSVRKKAAAQGIAPEFDMTKQAPEGFTVKGISTYYDKDGKPRGQWVKTNQAAETQFKIMQEAIEALSAEMPQAEPRPADAFYASKLMAVYPLGDPHIGMRAWAAECGGDWDLNKATKAFTGIFDRLVKSAPRCAKAVIVNLGDFFHADNLENVTSRSGHHLDVDGRYSKMISVGMLIIRRMIESALEHHEEVRVINAIGNHDDTGAMFLSVALAHIYEHEPRVYIDTSPAPFHYVRHGKCLIGAHHGHTCKADRLPMVMATDRATDWGETEYRYWLTGHIHHDTLKEYAGCKVESFRTLAAKDAYATWGGYRAGQDSKCLVLHKEYGEIERHTINISMLGTTTL